MAQFEGNLRFRMLVEEHKHRYTGTTNRKEKKRIAQEIRDIVKSRGGRFLKQSTSDIDDDEDVTWVLVEDEGVIVEKCKQALREKHTYAFSRDTDGSNGSFQSMIQADVCSSYSSQANPFLWAPLIPFRRLQNPLISCGPPFTPRHYLYRYRVQVAEKRVLLYRMKEWDAFHIPNGGMQRHSACYCPFTRCSNSIPAYAPLCRTVAIFRHTTVIS